MKSRFKGKTQGSSSKDIGPKIIDIGRNTGKRLWYHQNSKAENDLHSWLNYPEQKIADADVGFRETSHGMEFVLM